MTKFETAHNLRVAIQRRIATLIKQQSEPSRENALDLEAARYQLELAIRDIERFMGVTG